MALGTIENKAGFISHGLIANNQHEAVEKSIEACGGKRDAAWREASRLRRLLQRWKGLDTSWSVLKGLGVLDLASGSGHSDGIFRIWYPYFSRLCAISGAGVVAIDQHPQIGPDKTLFN